MLVLQGFITNADYSGKKTVMVLFINGRPVECSPLKKAIENTYSSMLPKAAKPWLYLVGPCACLRDLQIKRANFFELCAGPPITLDGNAVPPDLKLSMPLSFLCIFCWQTDQLPLVD